MKRYFSLFSALSMSIILFTQCVKRIYVPIDHFTERTDTLYRNILHSDSTYIRDSVVVEYHNDTIRIEHWHDRWRNSRELADSVRIVHDSVRIDRPYPVEVVKEVSRPVNEWQKILQSIGLVSCIILILKTYKKYKRH